MGISALPPYPEHDEPSSSQRELLAEQDAAGRLDPIALVFIPVMLAVLALVIGMWFLASVPLPVLL